jgi:hypothetical protein
MNTSALIRWLSLAFFPSSLALAVTSAVPYPSQCLEEANFVAVAHFVQEGGVVFLVIDTPLKGETGGHNKLSIEPIEWRDNYLPSAFRSKNSRPGDNVIDYGQKIVFVGDYVSARNVVEPRYLGASIWPIYGGPTIDGVSPFGASPSQRLSLEATIEWIKQKLGDKLVAQPSSVGGGSAGTGDGPKAEPIVGTSTPSAFAPVSKPAATGSSPALNWPALAAAVLASLALGWRFARRK